MWIIIESQIIRWLMVYDNLIFKESYKAEEDQIFK